MTVMRKSFVRDPMKWRPANREVPLPVRKTVSLITRGEPVFLFKWAEVAYYSNGVCPPVRPQNNGKKVAKDLIRLRLRAKKS